MANIIAGLIVVACLAAAITYIVKAKKKGVECIGCPAAGQCKSCSGAQSAESGGYQTDNK